MSQALVAERSAPGNSGGPLVNDFSIQVATVNGSGSQSANNVLMRAIFQMGIPVSGKNLFPSNIAGLPTWFTIRANKHGYVARKAESEIFVAMNADTFDEDVKGLQPGALLIYNADLKKTVSREDLNAHGIPFGKIVAECCPETKLRKLVTNMIYVGIVAELIRLDMAQVESALNKQFKGKAKAAELNMAAVKAGAAYAKENLPAQDRFLLEPMNATAGKILIDGNQAAAIGCVFGGCTVVTWYPITPSSSLCESTIKYLQKTRVDKETGKATFAVVQAEDELASVGMVIGAGWAGARAMTATAGPGISLMNEFVGLGYFTEVPGVIFDVQRVGPSTGLPTRTMQGDVLSLFYCSHGDTQHPVIIPASPEESYQFAIEAFDLAEQLQTPVFVMLDLDLGMNLWMSDAFPYPAGDQKRGKVLDAEQLEKLGKFERYRDVDGDAVPYRTLPGTKHPLAAYFTRGSGHNEAAQYTEKPQDYVNLVDRLRRKLDTAKGLIPQPIEDWRGSKVGVIGYGTTDYAMTEARDALRAAGVETNYLRLRALPFTDAVRSFVDRCDHVYVIDQNRDGQMCDLLKLEMGGNTDKLRSVRHYDGMPLDAKTVVDALLAQERK